MEENSDKLFSSFLQAIRENRFEEIKNILNSCTATILNNKTANDETAVLIACSVPSINLDIIKLLINHGADINTPDKLGSTCLNEACENNNCELVELLLNNNCDLNAVANEKNGNFLHILAKQNNCDLLNFIMKHKRAKNIDINIRNDTGYIDEPKDGHTPLMVACDNLNFDIAEQFIKYGADINIIYDDWSETKSALHFCADKIYTDRHVEFFEHLFNTVNSSIFSINIEGGYERMENEDDVFVCKCKQALPSCLRIIKMYPNNIVIQLLRNHKLWQQPHGMNLLIKILDHPEILSLLQESFVYDILFSKLSDVNSNIHMDNYMKIFLKLGHLVNSFDPYNFYLLLQSDFWHKMDENSSTNVIRFIANRYNFNIDHDNIFLCVLQKHRKHLFEIMKYCIKHNYFHVIETMQKHNCLSSCLKLTDFNKLLGFCTPKQEQIRTIIRNYRNYYNEKDDEELRKIFNDFHRFPSLVELARDTYRHHIGSRVNNTKEYIEFMDNLIIPKHYHDVITLRRPIYNDCC